MALLDGDGTDAGEELEPLLVGVRRRVPQHEDLPVPGEGAVGLH